MPALLMYIIDNNLYHDTNLSTDTYYHIIMSSP